MRAHYDCAARTIGKDKCASHIPTHYGADHRKKKCAYYAHFFDRAHRRRVPLKRSTPESARTPHTVRVEMKTARQKHANPQLRSQHAELVSAAGFQFRQTLS